ncbi:EcsC family protein [Agrilutibacter solisilvae]|uniref:EcsC family protein n=1 Tax=Agrilutibacter solisilvae TaxID=2763317 RepID=A0A974Y1L7_9GAMM|nr:EcsC family protein [Lysobacter solisilvae]QSX78873.1 EcsC family protein [Lysobacter solisilvae]
MPTPITAQDMHELRRAVALLERPSLSIQIANLIGSPVDWAVSKLPGFVTRRIQSAVRAALYRACDAALFTLKDAPRAQASTRLHKLAAAGSGAVGGFFGWAGLVAELPVSTTIMMRAVADIARSEGFSLQEPAVQAACIEVFALGGRSEDDDAAESGYYAMRGMVAEVGRHTAAELARQVGDKSVEAFTRKLSARDAGHVMARLIESVAARFGVVITEKTAAQMVPVLGAAAGATLNTLFTSHYQDMARGHFIVMRLERSYGHALVQSAYRDVYRGTPRR